MFSVHYTEDILAETVNTIRRRNLQFDGQQITYIADLIRNSMTARIERYPAIPDAPLEDKDDLHVHAAAVAARMDVVLTGDTGFLNLSDEVKDTFPYEICSADDFFLLADDSWPELVRLTTRRQQTYWNSKGMRNIASQLVAADCTQFAGRVREHLQALYG